MNRLIPKSIIIKLLMITCLLGLLLTAVASLQLRQLSLEIRSKFDGNRWSVPAVVYARPLELYPGRSLNPAMFEMELQLAGYRVDDQVASSGGYSRDGNLFELVTRDFTFPSGLEKKKSLMVLFQDDRVLRIVERITGEELGFVRLDPARIGSFHPLVHEDRVVLQKNQIPDVLREALIAVEDKKFLSHHGISVSGIVRAMLANVKAGRTVQGGSTLTQQLVKNFFLNRERTLRRKLQEVIMALILEFHYSKDEIMTAYINEVFLGQDGSRAIHGFGLASQFYFRRDLADLSTAQIATLVGMVKGPSLYDPLRRPENCLARREAVLNILLADQLIDDTRYAEAIQQPLTDVTPQKNGFNRFPDFLELVRRQLRKEYKETDLKSSGLKILTTLDPQVQLQAEKQLQQTLADLERTGEPGEVEGAVVITGRENGEVHAVVGGKNRRQSGFNRALDAKRPIGSLIKPAVYLRALTDGYNLATPLNDTAIELENNGKRWKPRNYDNREHGQVALYTALAKSYNLATVRLGVEVGLDGVVTTINDLGFTPPSKVYPSLLLGSLDMTPLQVTQLYQTIASGGFYLPMRSIQSVLASDDSLLTRYGLKVEQRFSSAVMYLLNHGLVRVMEEGTGKNIYNAEDLTFAGKTGTTNGLRDSWFAGYSGDRLAVVWLGNDDNKTISLSGAKGALVVWGRIMRAIEAKTLKLTEPEGIVWRRVDRYTLQPATIFNTNSTVLPFVAGFEPDHDRRMPALDVKAIEDKAKEIIDSFNNLIK